MYSEILLSKDLKTIHLWEELVLPSNKEQPPSWWKKEDVAE